MSPLRIIPARNPFHRQCRRPTRADEKAGTLTRRQSAKWRGAQRNTCWAIGRRHSGPAIVRQPACKILFAVMSIGNSICAEFQHVGRDVPGQHGRTRPPAAAVGRSGQTERRPICGTQLRHRGRDHRALGSRRFRRGAAAAGGRERPPPHARALFVQHHNWLLASCAFGALRRRRRGRLADHRRGLAEVFVLPIKLRAAGSNRFLHTYGRAALAAAAAGGDRKVLLARAAAAASRLERENARWATAMAKMLRASVAHQTRNPRAAIDCLTAAAATFRAVPMHLYAAAVDWQLGNLQEGAAAADLSRRAEDEMRALGVQNPARMAARLVTGLVRP